jgi:hypothetical protein
MTAEPVSLGPYVVMLSDVWKARELIEQPPTFRLSLGASPEWVAGIWIELDGWERCHAGYLEDARSSEWQCGMGFRWLHACSEVRDPDDPRAIVAERENFAARWSDDLIGFHISFFEQMTEDRRDAARALMSVTVGGAIVGRGPPSPPRRRRWKPW